MAPSEPDWPNRLAPGNPEREAAIHELRRFLLRGVRAGLSRRTGTGDDFIEDVVQTALPRILDRLDRFEGRSAFTTWAVAVALRVAFTEMKRRNWNHVSLDELRERGAVLPEEADPGPDPQDSAARRSLIALLRKLIDSELTPRQRDMLQAELNGMPHDEIASKMRLTRNAVYKLGHDARRALRRALEAAGYGVEDVLHVLEGAGEAGTSWR
jgi:RNA polymerase sigma-70 factor (ECF subfamily)